jgi:hypothetical protein
MKLTIGADPEFFVKRGRHIISGHLFDCGTKSHPQKTEHGYVQVDGIALECNVRPSSTKNEFVTNLVGVIADLNATVRNMDKEASIVARPSVFVGHRFLRNVPVRNAALGCSPDFSAYTLRRNSIPDGDLPIRTGAGHIHIGWTEQADERSVEHMEQCGTYVRQLDYYLGLPSLLWDKDSRRRTLYGKAGAFRPKPYGLEYRVLSNAWLDTDRLMGWVYDRTVRAIEDADDGNLLYDRFGPAAQSFIDNSERMWPQRMPELAKEILV